MKYILLGLLFCNQSLWGQLNLQEIGHLSYSPVTLAGCWHYVDSFQNEYALVGTSAGLSIVDLNDPTQPVERFAVPSLQNNWREVKTWNGFAYFGSEAFNSGVTIVDLRSLPDTVYHKVWYGVVQGDTLVRKSHTVQAENGYLYVFGVSQATKANYIADLSDPWNPEIVGNYNLNYIHDGFIRGDTLWSSEIYTDGFGVVDISDRANPILLATNPTPAKFNHNSGLSDNSKILFTADERLNAPMCAFDVSDLDNIKLLDKYLCSQKPERMVHNVRVLGDYVINPSYGGQLTIVDASRPSNLIETAWVVMGNSLVWDADPYLPSGIIFATAKAEGLFIYQPTYQHAAWLEGAVTDAISGFGINNATVRVINTTYVDSFSVEGTYKTGVATTGTYTVEASKPGYLTTTIANVSLVSGQVTTLDIAMNPLLATDELYNQQSIVAYPTLFEDLIRIDLDGKSEKIRLQMIDVQGKIIRETILTQGQNTLEDLGNLEAGSYVLQCINGSNQVVFSQKVIKK